MAYHCTKVDGYAKIECIIVLESKMKHPTHVIRPKVLYRVVVPSLMGIYGNNQSNMRVTKSQRVNSFHRQEDARWLTTSLSETNYLLLPFSVAN